MAQTVENLPVVQETWIWSLDGKMPWRREWQPTPVFSPGKLHGQGSLVGYGPWGCKESDKTELLTHTHTHTSLWVVVFYILSGVHSLSVRELVS